MVCSRSTRTWVPSTSSGTHNNEAFVGVSADGGHTWADDPIPCSPDLGGSGSYTGSAVQISGSPVGQPNN
jgi:hypothetical protein